MQCRVASTRSEQLPCMRSSPPFPEDSEKSLVARDPLSTMMSRCHIEMEEEKRRLLEREEMAPIGCSNFGWIANVFALDCKRLRF